MTVHDDMTYTEHDILNMTYTEHDIICLTVGIRTKSLVSMLSCLHFRSQMMRKMKLCLMVFLTKPSAGVGLYDPLPSAYLEEDTHQDGDVSSM